MDGNDLVVALRREHGCPPDCAHCEREEEAWIRPKLERFAPLIESDLGLRLARNLAEFGLEIPSLSDDPWEQYLISEALLARFKSEAEELARERREREEARREAQRMLAEEVQRRGTTEG